jgi:hypothetical protein
MFTVHLPQEAVADLRAAWYAGRPGACAALLYAMRDLHARLEASPSTLGESRGSVDERIAFGAGVAVTFKIDRERQLVRVVRAWSVRRR